jgi:hypothetical protein
MLCADHAKLNIEEYLRQPSMEPVEQIGRIVKDLERRMEREGLAAEHALEDLYKQIAHTMILLVQFEHQNNYVTMLSSLKTLHSQLVALKNSKIITNQESRKNLDELIRLTDEHIRGYSMIDRHVFASPGEKKAYYMILMRKRFNETIGKELQDQYLTLQKAREILEQIE